jgi:hypothetical protein
MVRRKNNIQFIRSQVLKNKCLGPNRARQLINMVNGPDDQISYTVSLCGKKTLTGYCFINFLSLKNIKTIMRRNRTRERRHIHFSQTRHRKITQTILNFIYFSTIVTLGFVTSISLQTQIEYLFNEKLAIKTICKQRKLLSTT